MQIYFHIRNYSTYFDNQFQLTWDRVGTTQKGVILKILKSKTIQDLSRVLEIPLARSQLSELCPVAVLERLWSIPGYPKGAKDSAFNSPGNGGWIPLSRSHVVPVLEAQIRGMGLQPELYRPHAFRRGGIQQ